MASDISIGAGTGSCKQFVTAKIPEGFPDESIWKLESVPAPGVADGKLLLQPIVISVDPYLRHPVYGLGKVGEVQRSFLVAEVVESRHSEYNKGEHIFFDGLWKTMQEADPAGEHALWRRVNRDLAPLSKWLGPLGMPGGTAYFGTKEVMQVKQGDVIFVSAAAGAVGSMVGQLAKAWGAKTVIGLAGGPDKCKLLTEKLGFDAAIDRKLHDTKEKVLAELQRLAPGGLDAYFDNTGGPTLAAAVAHMKKAGRIAVCGRIAEYNEPDLGSKGPEDFLKVGADESVEVKSVTWPQFADRWDEFEADMGAMLKSGQVKVEETVMEGFESIPKAFVGLFTGANTGKMVVQVHEREQK